MFEAGDVGMAGAVYELETGKVIFSDMVPLDRAEDHGGARLVQWTRSIQTARAETGAAGARRSEQTAEPVLLPRQFLHQPLCAVELLQHFRDHRGMHGHGAVGGGIVHEIAHQRFDIAVEDQTHDLAIPVDHR